jgi:thymidine kinase
MKSKLDIIIGPMFSGKSYELIRRIRLINVLNKKYLVLKPLIDNRYSSENFICTHNFDKESCLPVKNLYDCINDNMDYNTIFIDEAQFFPDLKLFVLEMLEKNGINIVLTGLDGDFERKPFGDILYLIPYSNSCVKKTALCKLCNDGTPGIFSHRIVKNSKSQILVGSTESYIPVCRCHYLELNE